MQAPVRANNQPQAAPGRDQAGLIVTANDQVIERAMSRINRLIAMAEAVGGGLWGKRQDLTQYR